MGSHNNSSHQKIGIDLLPLATAILNGEILVDYNQLFANLFHTNNIDYRNKSIKEVNLFQNNANFQKFIESINYAVSLKDFELKLWNNTPVFATTSVFNDNSLNFIILSLSKVEISPDNFKQILLGDKSYIKQILDSFESIICIRDKNGIIQLCNRGFEKLFGKNCEEIYGKSIFQLFPSEKEIDFLTQSDKELLEGTKNYIHLHHKYVDHIGKEHYLELTKTLIKIENSEYILTSAYDLTEFDFLRQLYEESSTLYKALIENAFDAIYLMKGRHYVYVNPRFCELTGYTFEELTDKNFDFNILIPEESKKYLEERYQARLQGKEIPNTYELQLLNKSGNRVYVEVSTVSVGKPGEVVVMGIMRDITQRKLYEQQLIEQQEQLKELNAAKDKFFNIIAHDLRAPISGLITLTQTLIQNGEMLTPDESKLLLQDLLEYSNQSLNLLENLLQWSRSQTKTIQFNPELVDLWEVAEAAKLINEPYARQKGISIINQIELQSFSSLDRNMINTIIRNLISNAVKYTEDGGKITISLEDLGDIWEIQVSDTGIGMTEEQISKLFKLGETQTSPGTRNEKGSGLGLLLVKEFVEKNGGTISVSSQKGKGTTFFIKLTKAQSI